MGFQGWKCWRGEVREAQALDLHVHHVRNEQNRKLMES